MHDNHREHQIHFSNPQDNYQNLEIRPQHYGCKVINQQMKRLAQDNDVSIDLALIH